MYIVVRCFTTVQILNKNKKIKTFLFLLITGKALRSILRFKSEKNMLVHPNI